MQRMVGEVQRMGSGEEEGTFMRRGFRVGEDAWQAVGEAPLGVRLWLRLSVGCAPVLPW